MKGLHHNVFEYPHEGKYAGEHFPSLTQENPSGAQYALEFWTLAAGRLWNERAFRRVSDLMYSLNYFVNIVIHLWTINQLIRPSICMNWTFLLPEPPYHIEEPMQLANTRLTYTECTFRSERGLCLVLELHPHY